MHPIKSLQDVLQNFGRAKYSNSFLTAASYSEAHSSMARNSAPTFVKCRGAILISDKGGTIGN